MEIDGDGQGDRPHIEEGELLRMHMNIQFQSSEIRSQDETCIIYDHTVVCACRALFHIRQKGFLKEESR
jgi:hypothetical protein